VVRCSKCGTESPDEARFCRGCGQRLGEGASPGAQAPTTRTAEERGSRLLEDAFRYSEEGRVLAAIEACQEAIALNPNSTSAHSLLGTLYERQGDRDRAIREYEQVLALSPGSTAERRRLNELMGVPSAHEGIEVSPRTARLAVTGGFVVVALVLVGAILLTTQQTPRLPQAQRERARPPMVATGPPPAEPATMVPAPGRRLTLGSVPAPRRVIRPRPGMGPVGPRLAQAPTAGTMLAPGTYLLPAGGAERFQGLRSPGGVIPRATRQVAPPLVGAVRVTRPGATTVATPGWRPGAEVAPAWRTSSPDLGRDYYFQRDYGRSIAAYESYLSTNPTAGPAPREELAWVYTEAGQRDRATEQYAVALDEYRADLNRGHNVEAAKHGARSCESALKALESGR
jgi:tetratricopeptide (TPR) repeat protein